jgi:hypothetical protein
MVQYEVDSPSRNFPGKTEGNHEESESGQSVSGQALNMEPHGATLHTVGARVRHRQLMTYIITSSLDC